MDRQVRSVGDPEEADQVDRIALEGVGANDVDAIVVDLEILGVRDRARPPAQAPDEAVEQRRRLGLALLERRADDRGQIADVLGDEEVVLHEPLDVDEPRPGRIAELTGDRPLNVETQALLRPAGEKVQAAAHGPEEFLAAAKQREFTRREHPGGDELVGAVNAIDVFRDPEQRVEIAQPPFALLDVGLDEIARRARPSHARLAFGELGGDEFGRRLGDDLLVEARPQRLEQLLVAGDQARLDQRGADGHVRARLPQAFIDRARGMADFQLEVPQHIKQRLDHPLDSGRRPVGQQEQEIDVRIGREHPAPVAANRDDGRQPLARLRRGEPARGNLEDHAQEVVGLSAQRFRACPARSAFLQRLARLVPPGGERLMQRLDRRAAKRRGVAGIELAQRRRASR